MDYRTARDLLGERESLKLQNNTYLQSRWVGGKLYYAVRLHATDVVTFHPTYTELDSGGWHTKTTAERIRNYAPVDIASDKRGWSIFLRRFDLPCYCLQDAARSDNGGIEVRGEYELGQELAFTKEWTGTPYDQDHGSKPIYEWRTCRSCNGTAKREGYDHESGGYPYFDGIRVNPNGTRLMSKQPRKPRDWRPIYTESGW